MTKDDAALAVETSDLEKELLTCGHALLRELDKVIRRYLLRDEDAAKNILWDNPRRIALLDWLIKELECNG